MKRISILTLILMLVTNLHAFDHKHAEWDRILKSRVKGMFFDYAGLKSERASLDAYLDVLASVPTKQFNTWQPNQRLAYLINLYNAATVQLVLNHHPIGSIKNIGGVKGPWKQPVVKAFGKTHTLDELEHKLIRGNFAEPRIHFALNCASVGCPPLAKHAFTADHLDRQLDAVTRSFLADRSRNAVNETRGELLLSPLFDWYREDFIKQSGNLEAFVAQFFRQEEQHLIREGKLKIRFGQYDWALNGK